MTEQKDSFDLCRVGQVIGLDHGLDPAHAISPSHVVPKDGPTIAHQVLPQSVQFRGQISGVGVIDDQKELAAVFDQGQFNARIEIAVTRVGGIAFDDLVFVSHAQNDVGVGVVGEGSRQGEAGSPDGVA